MLGSTFLRHSSYKFLASAIFIGSSVYNIHPISFCLPDSYQFSKIKLDLLYPFCLAMSPYIFFLCPERSLYFFRTRETNHLFALYWFMFLSKNKIPFSHKDCKLSKRDISFIYAYYWLSSPVSYHTYEEAVQYGGKSKNSGMQQLNDF